MEKLRSDGSRPWIVAHRGDSHAHPENTLVAFDEALKLPVDGIELDVQLTRDGAPVVYHDRTLAKVGRQRARVSGLGVAELRTLDAGSWFDERFRGARIPTLDEVLERHGPRTCLLIEIKARPEAGGTRLLERLTEATLEALERHRLAEHVLLLSFDGTVLERARERSPRLRTVQNLAKLPRRGGAAWRRLEPLFAISVDVRALTRRFVEDAHERGKPVLTYTCNARQSLARALTAGVDAIMTDRPGWLLGLLRSARGVS